MSASYESSGSIPSKENFSSSFAPTLPLYSFPSSSGSSYPPNFFSSSSSTSSSIRELSNNMNIISTMVSSENSNNSNGMNIINSSSSSCLSCSSTFSTSLISPPSAVSSRECKNENNSNMQFERSNVNNSNNNNNSNNIHLGNNNNNNNNNNSNNSNSLCAVSSSFNSSTGSLGAKQPNNDKYDFMYSLTSIPIFSIPSASISNFSLSFRSPHFWTKIPPMQGSPGPRAAHSCDLIDDKLIIFGGWNGKNALNDLFLLDTFRLQLAIRAYERNIEETNESTNNINECIIIDSNNITNINNSGVIVGGSSSSSNNNNIIQNNNEIIIPNNESMVWKELVANKFTPDERNNHATALVDRKLYIHGGHDGSKWLSDLHILDTDLLIGYLYCTNLPNHESLLQKMWIKPVVNGVAPSARACHTVNCVNNKLYMFGGYDGGKCFNDMDILDIDTMCWIQPKINGVKPQARNAHSMTCIDNHLFLFGGHSGQKHLTDLHIFDTDTLTWTQPFVRGLLPPGLRGHTSNLIGEKIFLFGGYDGKGRSNDIYILDTDHMMWLRPPECENAPSGRQRHSACLVENRSLYIFGGFDGNKWLNDLHISDLSKIEEKKHIKSAVNTLIDNLKSLINNKAFSDVILVVEGCEIYAHKNILACSCAYFKNMFTNNMKEKEQEKIEIKLFSYDAFMYVLEYLYTGRLNETNRTYQNSDVICEVLRAADHYGLDNLKCLSEHLLIHRVTKGNVCNFLKCADICQASRLKAYCLKYIFKNSKAITETDAFDELATIPSLIVEIAKLSLNNQKKKDNDV